MASYRELAAQALRTPRSDYGQYGLADYGNGILIPFLNAKKADELVNPGEVFIDLSHGRGNYSRDLGWTSNSFSNALAQGASVFDIKRHENETYGPQFTGDLKKAAEYLNINTSKFKEAIEVPVLTQDRYDEYGNFIKGGEPVMSGGWTENGYEEPKPMTRWVSPDEQLYDAINKEGEKYFRWTGDSLIPGHATEGGDKSFQTVMYRQEGDVLKPVSAPVSHGGWQNADVYTGGSGFNFMRDVMPGIALVGGAALGMYGLDQLIGAGAAAGASSFGGLNTAMPAAGTSFGSLSSAVPAAGKVFGGLSYALPTTTTAAGSGLTLSGILKGADTAMNVYSKLSGGGKGGTGLNAPRTSSALPAIGASMAMLPAGGIYNTNQRQYMQPLMTDVEPDQPKKDDEEENKFGLADILRNFNTYG